MTKKQKNNQNVSSALALPEFRLLLSTTAFSTIASRSLAVILGYQVYTWTHNPLSLGYLGMVEAIPAIGLALYGGYVADRCDRRLIAVITLGISVFCALLLALFSRQQSYSNLLLIYGVVFLNGIARGFSDPASGALEGQIIPVNLTLPASALLSSTWQGCSIIGPLLGAEAYAFLGSNAFYLIAAFLTIAWLSLYKIKSKPIPAPKANESIIQNITAGVKFVFHNQPLIGSMALDLFAVLFGGAMALLPIFATDILRVGVRGLGFLNAAPSLGALCVMLYASKHPPSGKAGRTLFICVAGFGFSIILFALSRNFYLSLFALALSGGFDGISVVIRKAILRLMSPESMRGRIAAVSGIFIGSSNEIGAFESGVMAHLLGTVRSVWAGGVVTLFVVFVTLFLAAKLRDLSLEVKPEDAQGMELLNEQAI